MPVSPAEFRRALSQFASGVTVVTTRSSEGRPMGLTVSSFCSVSLEPPLVLVCIDNRSEARGGFDTSKVFGVSVLGEGQEDWSRRFASGGPEKFSGVSLLEAASGVVLVPGAVAHLECRVAASFPGGDHTIYLGEVMSSMVASGRPLLYHASGYRAVAQDADDS
jgi:flavin reductase ActVB